MPLCPSNSVIESGAGIVNLVTKIIRIVLLAFCVISFSAPALAQKKEPLLWFVWDLAPEFINSGPWKDQGYADKFLKFFIDNLPGYDHSIRDVNVPRWSREVLGPNRCTAHLWSGFFPDQLLLSRAYSFTPPHVAVFHQRHEARIGASGTVVSLEELLKQTDLTLMIMRLNFSDKADQSRYPVLHSYLAPWVGKANLIEQSSRSNVVNLRLLELGRADYTLGYPSTIMTQKRVNNLQGEYVTYHLKEHNLYKNVYVACRNDEFGRRVIKKINALLTDETLMKFLSYHEEWNNGDADFRRTTIDYFINNKKLDNVIK